MAALVLVIFSGCPASPSTPPKSAAPGPSLDAGAAADGTQDVREAASQMWAGRCAACHGPAGRGDTERGKALRIPDMSRKTWQAGRTNAQLARVIRNGYDGTTQGVRQHMPDFDELPDSQVRALVVLVRSFASEPSRP